MKVHDWNPKDGDALQGDVVLFRVPDDLAIDTADEIKAHGNRLILAEGEVTGHHHAIWLRNPPAMLREDGAGSGATLDDTNAMVAKATKAKARAGTAKTGTAKLYRDQKALDQLVRGRQLAHDRCAIGFLIVEGAPVTLKHDEHEAIRISEGRYYVGGQQEWDAAEARRVQD